MVNIHDVFESKLNLLWCICVLFYSSFVCTSAYANVYFKTICECLRQINTRRSEVHCGSAIEPGGSGLPYNCTPPVCAPYVLGALAVWWVSKKKHLSFWYSMLVCYAYFTVPIDVRITLLICLDSVSICMFISLTPAFHKYAYANLYAHLSTLPFSSHLSPYTYVHMFRLFCNDPL